jgi:hypothetical protein
MIEAWNERGEHRAVETDKANQFYGWVFYKHPDGQWVTLRKATEQELSRAETIAALDQMALSAETVTGERM